MLAAKHGLEFLAIVLNKRNERGVAAGRIGQFSDNWSVVDPVVGWLKILQRDCNLRLQRIGRATRALADPRPAVPYSRCICTVWRYAQET